MNYKLEIEDTNVDITLTDQPVDNISVFGKFSEAKKKATDHFKSYLIDVKDAISYLKKLRKKDVN